VRYRLGGETLKPVGDRHTRELRDLLQRGGIPPWERPRMPLVVDGDAVLAVADRWVSEAGKPVFEAAGTFPLWHRGD
jgi:tRNA(Ile)-lysidine synthase